VVSRQDGAVALVLLVLLAVLAGTALGPSLGATAAGSATPAPSLAAAASHVQGVVGRPSSITPLTARTQADRDLVALLFRGLVRLGPGATLLPDLADRWTVDAKGAAWTFHLRDDARWHDGTPVTSADVVYTIHALQDPGYAGPLAATWARVGVAAPDARTVRFELGDPAGGFLQAATLPLLPAHLLQGVPAAALADHAFGREPLGNGAFALVELTEDAAVLEPVLPPVVDEAAPLEDPAPGAADTRAPRLARLELRFYDTPGALAAAFAAGEVASAAGLPGVEAMALAAATPDARAIRYPGTTVTAVAFNLRSPKGPFADARTRRALLAALDRGAMVDALLGGAGSRADTLIPPSSWAFSAKSAPEVAYDRSAAVDGLKAAGWRRVNRAFIAPGAKKPLALVLLAPEQAASPIAHDAAGMVAASWTSLGLATTVEAVPPAEFVERLRSGKYSAAVVDVNMGLDPDPYPILGSAQVREGGSNVAGFQSRALDAALLAARAPGSGSARRKAYRALQEQLGALQPMATLFFRDSVLVAGPGLAGPAGRAAADPADRFWDVVRWKIER
jgi:peptide/nickel transport system substrate-binding protein